MSTSNNSNTKESMENNSRRRVSGPKAGSVWESRMKLDEVKGGIKVLISTHDNDQNPQQTNTTCSSTSTTTTTSPVQNPESQMDKKLKPKQSPAATNTTPGKRKTWKSENSEGSPVQIARQRSDVIKNLDDNLSVKKSPVLNRRLTRSVNEKRIKNLDEPSDGNLKKINSVREIKQSPDEIKVGSDEDCKDLVVFEEKKIAGSVVQSDKDEEEDKEIEVEKKSLDVEEITVHEKNLKKIVIEEKRFLQSNESPLINSSIVKKQAANHAKIHPIPAGNKPGSDNFNGVPRTSSRLQSFVDLVMWRDVSRSAFVFGLGTFIIISSSYTKDLNISFISVVSYLGLVYLAAIFLFRSLITRGSMDNTDDKNQEYVVGEEEAIWIIKLLLPFVNEFLLQLRALFSGDPATTMKLAVLLFILARCGSSITIWKMAKLGFIGVFTVPKVCSSYSSHLTAYGTFWIRRFKDAWESCSHKKAVGFGIFTLVWNLSSVVARIWAVFMLFVAFKYYQHSLIREGWAQEESRTEDSSSSWQNNGGSSRPLGRRTSTFTEVRKQKKVC